MSYLRMERDALLLLLLPSLVLVLCRLDVPNELTTDLGEGSPLMLLKADLLGLLLIVVSLVLLIHSMRT